MRWIPLALLALLGAATPPNLRPAEGKALATTSVPPAATAPDPTEAIAANDNRRPAGRLERGVLTVALEVRTGVLRPEEDGGPGLVALAFAEVGGPLQVPGPLLRVPQGTELRVSIRNPLDTTLVIHGLGTPARGDSGLVVPAGETRQIRFRASAPGTWYYWGAFPGLGVETREWLDSQLAGALIVDPSGAPTDDRVFVLGLWSHPQDDSAGLPRPAIEHMTINGKSWPYTERLSYPRGRTVRWRVINPTISSHPMHLHGFFFHVEGEGDWQTQRAYRGDARPLEVTHLMNPGTTLALSWLPEREGNWVFHCHFPFHVSSHMGMPRDSAERSAEPWLIAASGGNATGHSDGRTESPHAQGESASAHVEVTPVVAHGDGAQPVAPTNNRSTSADRNPASAYDPRPTSAQVEAAPASAHTQGGAKAAHPMGGLVLGIHVTPGATPEPRRPGGQPREIRLLAQSSPHRYGAIRGMGYVVQEGGAEPARDSIDVPGPALVLRRGQPVRLTVVNHLAEPTAVHWHGIELESWADGVPGWSGNAAQVMPPIQPGDSFVAEFVPPRAGTYIYHTHSNEQLQMGSGLYGPLLVVDPARPYDPETDKVFIVGGAGPADSLPQFGYQSPGLVNGSDTPSPLDLEVGRTYRLRMININPDWRVIFSLTSASALQRWRPVAKDGADLPASQRTPRPAWLLTGPGETADFEFTPLVRGDLRLEVKTLLPGWIVPVTVRVR